MAAPLRVKAIYEYSSAHDDDLNFDIGQVIVVTDEEDPDWYGGEYTDDSGVKHEGIFPRNFVEKFEPVAPPRPTRTRTKKEPEPAPAAPEPVIRDAPEETREPEPVVEEPEQIEEQESEAPVSPPAQRAVPPPPPAAEPAAAAPEPIAAASPPKPTARSTTSSEQSAPPAQPPKPKPAGPPPVSEKPKSNAFKDRIAAFNKPSEAPITPFKPGGLSGGYSKKPFVPPPPSRDAYVPLPKDKPPPPISTYKRDEDPEIKQREAENLEQAQKAGLAAGADAPEAAGAGGDDEDQPKPTTLKERIALLQKQQQEQAQRHAETAAKKEKPKKPVKKRTESSHQMEPASGDVQEAAVPASAAAIADTEEIGSRTSTDEGPATRAPPPPRRKSSKGPGIPQAQDGNEADMSGAGDTTEDHDDTTEREDSGDITQHVPRVATGSTAASKDVEQEAEEDNEEDEGEGEEEEEDEDVDPEVKRREELRARMAKMSGGMGFGGMFGGPMPPTGPAPPKKKKAPKSDEAVREEAEEEEVSSPQSRGAPPIPTMMALPGMGLGRKSGEMSRPEAAEPTMAPPPPVPARAAGGDSEEEESEEEEDEAPTPAATVPPSIPPRDPTGPPPPVPGGRPAPPPVPTESRPPPPPPPANLETPSDGSESDDEMSGNARDPRTEHLDSVVGTGLPIRSPPQSPRMESAPTSGKRMSRPPPPIPGAVPAPPPASSRPPPPPPPAAGSEASLPTPTRPPQAGEENDEEATEYEGDYDTDIASSVPHKDALKAHARESSQEDNFMQSPTLEAPPAPSSPPPRGMPPPLPSQPPPEGKRRSVDVPRGAPPPPPPPSKDAPPMPPRDDDIASPSSRPMVSGALGSSYSQKAPMIEEETYFPQQSAPTQSPPDRRAPPPAPANRGPPRQSMDQPRASMSRRSMDRPAVTESGFIANDIDLAVQSGWFKQANQVPPVLQGRKDIFFESEESTSTNGGTKTIITREIFVLFQDYSQTILTVNFDPYNPADVEIGQRHEPPPRALRQDQMEEFYERFGRPISEAVAAKKDTVVPDGTPQGLVLELLRPFKDALRPVGTRAYGALVYANMANASTQQNDVIRPGDILTIRNAKFQGKHGAMHAKYSMEVGKPDHVAVVAEWDGTKKKVRAWEQGRESKKVKMESFKLDDLRSGEVKIWRVMPRSWVGWNTQP